MKKGHPFITGLLFCLFLFPLQAYGQELIRVEDGEENIVINPHVYILKDKSIGIQEIEKVATAPDSAFRKNTYFQEVHYGFSQPFGWCKFAIKNTSDHTKWIIKVHQSRVDTVQLYVQRENGDLVKYPLTGHFQNLKDRAFHSMSFAHPVYIKKNETVVCYLFTLRKFARHAAVLSLQQEGYHKPYNTQFIILISGLKGICILASLIGIVMFVVLYERVYIFYSIYCFSLLLLIAIDSGFIYAFTSAPTYQKLINNLSIIFFYLVAGWHTLVTIELLKIKRHQQRWLYWLGLGSGLLFCLAALILLLPIPDIVRQYISIWSYYILFFLNVYILYAIIIQLIRKEVMVFFYAGGFLITLVTASISRLADLQIIEGVNHRSDMLFIAPVVEIICMVIGLGINSSRYAKDKLKAQRQIITVQEDERKRIAQDLHDDVGNSLAAIKNMLSQRKDPLLAEIEKEIDDIIRDIRNISHDLMPVDFQKYALTDIVRQTVKKFRGHPHIQFEYNQTGATVKLHPVAELVIYRIINELITNSIKHSHATHVMIQLIYQDKSLMVMVEDNGTGIKKGADMETGIGLKNIRHRVAYINGSFAIESDDDRGTLFIIEIPYASR
jgi:signal transduction histidine kinase